MRLEGGVQVRLLDLRESSLGLMEELISFGALYVLLGQLPIGAMPAAYIGESGGIDSARWEVSYLTMTKKRACLQVSHVLLCRPDVAWSCEQRRLVEATTIRALMGLGGVAILNGVTAAPRAWRVLSPAQRALALVQADGIVDVIDRGVFPGRLGGGVASSAGGCARDATVRHLARRNLPATDRDLAAEDRWRAGLRASGATPWASCRVDLGRREMRTGRPRVYSIDADGQTYYAPAQMPIARTRTLAADLERVRPAAEAAARAALV